MQLPRTAALFVALIAAAMFTGTAHAERRLALVIGNDNYQHLEKLQKAAADARQYADVLKGKGFDEVVLKTDLSRSDLDLAIASFLDGIQPGDTVVFAYSGHGWSDGSQNYIVGTDAPEQGNQELLSRISIPLKNGVDGIIDDMDRKGARLKVAIIDACRSNPFTPVPGKRAIGLSRGLVRIDPPEGTFVVFSAGAGQSALDRLSDNDPDPNSVFTRVFAPLLRADITLQDAVKTAQEQVVALANSIKEDQRPAYYDEVLGGACLGGGCTGKAGGSSQTQVQSPDEAIWTRISTSNDPAEFDSFLRLFPSSPHAAEAHARAASLRSGQTQVTKLEPADESGKAKNGKAEEQSSPDTPLLALQKGEQLGGAAFSPDGALIATTAGSDHISVKIWEAASGKLLRTLRGHTSDVNEVEFSPDGSRLVSASADNSARVWDTATGRLLLTLQGHSETVASVRFSPDGGTIVTGSVDHTAAIWDAATGRLIHRFNRTGIVESVVFSPDGSLLAMGGTADPIKIINPASGATIKVLGGPKDSVNGLAISPDGRRLASGGDKSAWIWDIKTGKQLWKQGYNDDVTSVAFSPDGRFLATGCWDNSIQVWDTQTGLLAREMKDTDSIRSVTFSPDGERLLVSGLAGATIWDVRDLSTNVAAKGK